jgi:mRNA interferase HicA
MGRETDRKAEMISVDYGLETRTFLSDIGRMKGSELLRRVRDLGHQRGVSVQIVSERGKGSHGTLHYGERHTVIPDLKKELKTDTLHAMLKQPGLTMTDLKGGSRS